MVIEGGRKQCDIAQEIGVHYTTIRDWVKEYKTNGTSAFSGSGNMRPVDDEIRRLRRENADLKEENDILKRRQHICEEPEIKRFKFIEDHRFVFRVAKLCEVLKVSRSGFYSWCRRPKNKRQQENELLLKKIKEIHEKKKRIYGYPRIAKALPKDMKVSG